MVSFAATNQVAHIRSQLTHPVIDADGHHMEFMPLVWDCLREIAGPEMAALVFSSQETPSFPALVAGDLASRGIVKARTFYTRPTRNTLDHMTPMLPELLYRRLEEVGIDFALLYPSAGLVGLTIRNDELRQAMARSFNMYYARAYTGYRDRLEPAAVIPTFTPGEAIAELDYAVGTLGLKTVVMSGVVPRTVRPDGSPGHWIDTLAFDSLYDYDPLWKRCSELGVVPTFHGVGYGWGSRTSTKNYVYNHLGNFAAAQEAVCRALVMGGVPMRYPDLRFSFLEGGVTWACQLFADLLGHWAKRNKDAVMNYAPELIDRQLAIELFETYANGPSAGLSSELQKMVSGVPSTDPNGIDDFAQSLISSSEDIVHVFTDQFSFGCEADDPLNALAFRGDLLPHRARLNAMFASDIGHWDVPDMREVLPEAWELVEHGQLDEHDFAEFTCGNVTRMLTAGNQRFFVDTAVEDRVGAKDDEAR